MTPYYSDSWLTVYEGDCRAVMAEMEPESVHCVVTSPPYWGLRDYGTATWVGGGEACDHLRAVGGAGKSTLSITGHAQTPEAERRSQEAQRTPYRETCGKCGATRQDSQLGLEPTPEEYVANMVAVFREVRRVLRADGTVWLVLGDSYASSGGERTYGSSDNGTGRGPGTRRHDVPASGLKPKDLVGIPWRVAFALQQPYYTGTIRDERDRIWLAAMLDAEGCLFIHKRKPGQHNGQGYYRTHDNNGQGYYRTHDNYGPGVEISNTSLAVIERIKALVGKGSISTQGPEQNARRKQTIYRWNLRTIECRDFVRELYPYLVAKKQQARILIGCPSSGERAEAAHAGLMALHRTGVSDVDFPEPESMLEPGWYLRSDIIWAKKNCMPESVTDRPTKAHEYLFLLSKSPRYYWDADAVREARDPKQVEWREKYADTIGRWGQRREDGLGRPGANSGLATQENATGRNIRSVWTVATEPYGMVTPESAYADGPLDTLSPDCPVHSLRAIRRNLQTGSDDGLLDQLRSRSQRSGSGRAVTLADGQLASSLLDSLDARPSTTGYEDPGSSPEPTPGSARGSRTPDRPTFADGPTSDAGSVDHTSRTLDPTTDPAGAEPAQPGSLAATRHSERESRTTDESDELGSSEHSTASHTPDTGAGTVASGAQCSCPKYSQSHFATFPEALVEPCVKAGCPYDGVVFDPFAGSGTVGRVAQRLGRRAVLIDLNGEYLKQAMARNADIPLGLGA